MRRPLIVSCFLMLCMTVCWAETPLLEEQSIPGYHLLKSSRDSVDVNRLLRKYPRMDPKLFSGKSTAVSMVEQWLNLTKKEWNKQRRDNDPNVKVRSIFLERTEMTNPQQAFNYASCLAQRLQLVERIPAGGTFNGKCWFSGKTTNSRKGAGYTLDSVLCAKNMVIELSVNGEGVTKDFAEDLVRIVAGRL